MRRYGLLIVAIHELLTDFRVERRGATKERHFVADTIRRGESLFSFGSKYGGVFVFPYFRKPSARGTVEGPFSTSTFLLKNLLYLSFFTFNSLT